MWVVIRMGNIAVFVQPFVLMSWLYFPDFQKAYMIIILSLDLG
jgi:hypothetical protein